MQYLEVPFAEKNQAKALGARWDAVRRKWFVPTELTDDLTPFQRWLPAQSTLPIPETDADNADQALSLTTLLAQVGETIHARFATPVWIRAEIAELSERRHLYLHLVETDGAGQELASVRATLWQSQIERIVGKFRQATGSPLAAGQKVLLRVQVRFHPRFGLSLNIEDIDPSYTLGDIQAQLARLREQLKKQGLYDRNRQLPLPQEFTRVAVIAPPKAAGLGDFQRDARLLQDHDLCDFVYFHASFQGDAVEEAFMAAFDAMEAMHARNPFDALVIIRGGGAQLDLHQLNRLSIAQRIARCPAPVFTGIGHERDNTLLDEVAARRFDTPSKVIAHIREVIVTNARTASEHWLRIQHQARQQMAQSRAALTQLRQRILHQAQQQHQQAVHQLHQLAQQVHWQSGRALQQHRQHLDRLAQKIQHQANLHLKQQRIQLDQLRQHIRQQVAMTPKLARERVEQWMRHILLLGPQQQLARGFALVRDEQGRVVRNASDLDRDQTVTLQFHDGQRTARIEE